MITLIDKNADRIVRHKRVRTKISGTKKCPRLCVYRSLKNISAQIIDDESGTTIVSCSTLEKDVAKLCEGMTKTQQAKIVGEEIAKRAIKKKISEIVFDRGGYLYTGRVQALADGARETGLKF